MNERFANFPVQHAGDVLLDSIAGRILCSVPVGLVVLDQAARIVTTNQFFAWFLHRNQTALSGRRLDEVLEHTGMNELVESVLSSGTSLFDRRLQLNTGRETLAVNLSVIELHDDTGSDERRLLLVLDDVTEQDKYERALGTLAVAGSDQQDDDDFYRRCVRDLAGLYEARYAYIALVRDDDPGRATILALWADGEFLEPFDYSLHGTPCQDVLDRNMEFIPSGLGREYPDDEMLHQLGIESYFGAPMLDSRDRVRGLVAVMDTRPLQLDQWTRRLLEPFAKRLALEWERDHSLSRLAERTRQYQSLIDYAPEGILVFDADAGVFVETNPRVCAMLGHSHEALLSLDPLAISPACQSDGRPSQLGISDWTERALDGEVPVFEWSFRHRDGSELPCQVTLVRMPAAGRRLIRATLVDISEHRRRAAEMSKLSSALEQTDELVMITDNRGRIEYVNRAFETVTGFSREEVAGCSPNIVKSGLQDADFYRRMWSALAAGEPFADVFVNKKRDGSIYYEEKTITPFSASGRRPFTHYVSTGKDITEQLGAQDRLRYLLNYNPLTDLPNRYLFQERLELRLEQAARERMPLALICLDIDRFHRINDTLGHKSGDALLREVARRLSARQSEEVELAHLGADQFVFILSHERLDGRIADFIQSLYAQFTTPLQLDGQDIFLSLSMGVSLYPDDGTDVVSLLANAETALFRSKQLGPDSYQFYTADMNARAAQYLDMENALRRALEREEFVLHYQPQVDLATARVSAVEALLRWQHPERGLVSPGEFIPLLEETGLIVPVGEWVLEQACREILPLLASTRPELRLAVNLSSLQFRRKGLTRTVEAALTRSGLPVSQLELEITESAVMHDQAAAIRIMETLAGMGLRLALDDFGTGFSSLSYLKEFPVSTLKLAQPFVNGLPEDAGDVAISRSVLSLAHNLGLVVVAEGVEHEAQLGFLSAEHCDLMQGYLFSRPVPVDELEILLRSGKSL